MASSRQQWLSTETGILRKKEDDDELLVFGYSCKLFRDDEKALYIDQGKHLIPWMGDEALKIDRYDGRGALYDLKQCEAPPGGYDTHRWVGLSEAERRVEQLCDEERYRALHHNEEEEALYQEEELKRLHKALDSNSYGEVAFNYDENCSEKMEEKRDGQAAEEEGGDEPFVPPAELDIPINMILPDTVKLNAIIEKTALFISQQGAQMEILLKMKQAGNPQFQFLSFDSPLHAYYRHLLMAIKTGRYRPKSQHHEKEAEPEDGGDEHYLHPSLAPGNSRVELAPSIPSISYKPSANCSYSMLVNSIKNRQASFGVNPLQQQQPPAPGTSDHILPMHYPTETAMPVTNDHIIEASPVLYTRDPNSTETPTAASAALYHQAHYLYQTQQVAMPGPTIQDSSPHNVNSSDEEHYGKPVGSVCGGDYSEPVSPSASETYISPPPDMQLIIDKMASYVAKNGRDFETIVKSKGDSRFVFLDENHQFHAYYQHKLSVYEKLEGPAAPPSSTTDNASVKEGNESSQDATLIAEDDSQDGSERSSDGSRNENSKGRNKPAPVCFSIKKPKENEALLLEKRSALPVEESTDEEDAQEGDKDKPKEEKKKEDTDKEVKQEAEVIDLTESSSTQAQSSASHNGDENGSSKEKEKKSAVDKAKWAEERLKDKLAAAAREKIAAAAREKQLQLERKRRAAAFLNMIRKDHPLGGPELPVLGPQLPDGTPVQRMSGDEDEVSSVPSPNSATDGHAPLQLDTGRQELEERLSSKANGAQSSQTTSLFARIQESKKCVKRRNASVSSNSSCGSHNSNSTRNQSHSHTADRQRHKKKRSSNSHKRTFASPSHSQFRPHKHKKEEEHTKHRKSKKKDRARSRSRSELHHSHKTHHHVSEKSGVRSHHIASEVHSSKKSHHKKNKKSSRNVEKRSNSASSSS